MDPIEIAMHEITRIENEGASAVLNATAGSSTAQSASGNSQEVSSNAELDIFSAAKEGRTEHIRALVESGRARVTDCDDDGITALHWAALNGKADTCRYLLDQGSEVNAVGGELLFTPLHYAARNGFEDIVHLLVQRDANPRLVDAQGFTSLHSVTHSSSFWGLLYIVCQLDPIIDEGDHRGKTALHWAVYQGDPIATQILLNFGADPNAVDHDGLTSLHWAAFNGNESCIVQLLKGGADIQMKTRDLRSAKEFHHNIDTWNKVVAKLGFKEDGTRVRRPLSEPNVKIIIFSVPSIYLCIAFTILGVFPWYMAGFLTSAVFFVMHCVRKPQSLRDSLSCSHWSTSL
ncbi:ankyrin repeat-containing domain protein [Lactifluus volemus]|nr:ankyrin repeat-containing domain protein [Lactifluus volemus]